MPSEPTKSPTRPTYGTILGRLREIFLGPHDRQQELIERVATAEAKLQAFREQVARGDLIGGGDRCQFCLGIKGGEPGREQAVGGALACAECAELVLAAIENTPAPRALDMDHVRDVVRKELSDAVMMDSFSPTGLVALVSRVANRVASQLSAVSDDDAADLGRVLQETSVRAAELARQEDAGELVSLVAPFGGTVTDPDEIEMHRQLQAQNLSRCATCQNVGWQLEGTIFCSCPYGEFLAKKIRATGRGG